MPLHRVDATIAATLVVLSRGVDLAELPHVVDADMRAKAERNMVKGMSLDEAFEGVAADTLPELARARVREILGLWAE